MTDSTTPPEPSATTGDAPDQGPGPVTSGMTTIDHERFFLVRLIDFGLAGARRGLSTQLVLESCRWLAVIGLWALVGFAALVVLWGLIAAIQLESFGIFAMAAGVALVALALLYTAGKLCNAGQAIIDATGSEMSSRAFLDCVALVSAVLAVVYVVGGIVVGITEGVLMPVGVGFGFGAWWAYLAAVALNPALVNATVRPGASAGQEFIGILSFILKALLRIVPIVFGVIAAIGTVLFAIGMVRYLAAETWRRGEMVAELTGIALLVLFGAALPLLAYIGVAAAYLLVDLARAILRIPGNETANTPRP